MHDMTSFLEDFRKNWQFPGESETRIELRVPAAQCLKHESPCDLLSELMAIAYGVSDFSLSEICSQMLTQK